MAAAARQTVVVRQRRAEDVDVRTFQQTAQGQMTACAHASHRRKFKTVSVEINGQLAAFRRVANDMRDGHQCIRHLILQEEVMIQDGLRFARQQQHAIDSRFAPRLRQRRLRCRQRDIRIPPSGLQRRVRAVFLCKPTTEARLFAVRIAMEFLLPTIAIEPFARVLRAGMVTCHRVWIFRIHVFNQRAKMLSGLLPPF